MNVLLFVWLDLVASAALMLALKVWKRRACQPLFAWFDLWVGVFWDARKRKLYVFPMPMLGVVVDFTERNAK